MMAQSLQMNTPKVTLNIVEGFLQQSTQYELNASALIKSLTNLVCLAVYPWRGGGVGGATLVRSGLATGADECVSYCCWTIG